MVLEIAMINSDNNNNGQVKDMSKCALRIRLKILFWCTKKMGLSTSSSSNSVFALLNEKKENKKIIGYTLFMRKEKNRDFHRLTVHFHFICLIKKKETKNVAFL